MRYWAAECRMHPPQNNFNVIQHITSKDYDTSVYKLVFRNDVLGGGVNEGRVGIIDGWRLEGVLMRNPVSETQSGGVTV